MLLVINFFNAKVSESSIQIEIFFLINGIKTNNYLTILLKNLKNY